MQFGVSEAVSFWGKYRPSTVAIYSDGKSTTYEQLDNLINILCLKINEKYPLSTKISIGVKNKLDFMIGLFAGLRLCKPVVLLNIGLSDEALKTNIEDTAADLLIYDNDSRRIAKLFNTSSKINITQFSSLNSGKGAKYTAEKEAKSSDLWGILFSSGSTGTPKGIERSQDSMVTEFIGWCLELNLNRKTIFYIGRPAFYTGSIVLSMATFIVNGTIIINNYNDDQNNLAIWKDYQRTFSSMNINWAFFIPDQLRVFIKQIKAGKVTNIKSAELILTMGGPITGNEKTETYTLLKSNIIESWGNTESLGTITDPEDIFIRPNSIGRPFLTDELMIVDDNGNKIQQSDVTGRIAGSEEAGFDKYSNRDKETSRVKQKNLIISDDLGYTDKKGFFYIQGRVQDHVIRNGQSIYISKIESKLRGLKFIKECCVLEELINESDFKLIAFVNCEKSLVKNKSLDSIKNSINKILLPYESIDEVNIVERIEKVPTGKINKPLMRQKYLSK